MTGTLILVGGKDPLSNDAGHSSYVRAHGLAARRAGYSPLVICIGRRPTVAERDFGTVVRLGSALRPIRNLMMPLAGPLLARGIVRLAAGRPEPVLVHGFSVWAYAGARATAALRARGRNVTAIASTYATHPAEARAQLLGVVSEPLSALASYGPQALWARAVVARYERRGLHEAAAIYANYDAVRRLVRAEYGDGLVIRDLPYASELAFADELASAAAAIPADVSRLEPREAPLLVSMSSHNGRKGVDVLIDAVARARDGGTPVRACLLGAGRLLPAHRRRIGALGLERSVAAPGWVADKVPYLRAADLFALPARAEQSGSVALLEALQFSLATVASAVDGIVEDVEDGSSALLVPPGDVEAMAAALERLARDRELRERIASEGRERFEDRFAAEPFAAALGEVYAEHGLEPSAPLASARA